MAGCQTLQNYCITTLKHAHTNARHGNCFLISFWNPSSARRHSAFTWTDHLLLLKRDSSDAITLYVSLNYFDLRWFWVVDCVDLKVASGCCCWCSYWWLLKWCVKGYKCDFFCLHVNHSYRDTRTRKRHSVWLLNWLIHRRGRLSAALSVWRQSVSSAHEKKKSLNNWITCRDCCTLFEMRDETQSPLRSKVQPKQIWGFSCQLAVERAAVFCGWAAVEGYV